MRQIVQHNNTGRSRLITVFALLILGLGFSRDAFALSLSSSGFSYSLTDVEKRFPTETGHNKIGMFNFSTDIFPVSGDRNGYLVTAIAITFTMKDGDTASGERDENDLALTLGIPETSMLLTLPLLLNGFANNQESTVTNTLDLSHDFKMGVTLATFLSNMKGGLAFLITDLDYGGNYLDFQGIPGTNFLLTFKLAKSNSPIPEPATVSLLGTGLIELWIRRRRIDLRSRLSQR